MKSLYFILVGTSILVHPVDGLAIDYTDLDAYCQVLQEEELELIKKELANGLLTTAEAKEDMQFIPDIEQCVCVFQKILDSAGADFTVYIQKLSLESYMAQESSQLEVPEDPEGLDIDALMESSEIACGIDIE